MGIIGPGTRTQVETINTYHKSQVSHPLLFERELYQISLVSESIYLPIETPIIFYIPKKNMPSGIKFE